jgi:outer membrane protein OmpA-like peptidoglycan-associated protein
MASVGVDFRMHYHEPPPPPAAAPPPPPPPPPPPVTVQNITGAHDVCAGDSLALMVSASGGAPGSTLTYEWMVNGQPAPGGTGNTFNLPTAGAPGEKTVTVKVSAGDQSATSSAVMVNISPLLPPTIQFNVNPATVEFAGPPIPLNANAMAPNACNGNLTVTYSGEGVMGNTFNPGSVGGFDQTNRLKQQTRSIPLTASVTDAHNQTASANATVTVTLKPQASRKDIVFPNRSSRVNNAAKRYLLEELTPQLRDDPNSSVILIGHRDMSETGRAAANLDQQRVLYTAAVLSAGKGVCANLDLSRVQVKEDGTDQTDPPMPFGDASVKERSGQNATDQRAQFRRVEVWFVPGGADAPNVTGTMPAPVAAIQAKGCPR